MLKTPVSHRIAFIGFCSSIIWSSFLSLSFSHIESWSLSLVAEWVNFSFGFVVFVFVFVRLIVRSCVSRVSCCLLIASLPLWCFRLFNELVFFIPCSTIILPLWPGAGAPADWCTTENQSKSHAVSLWALKIESLFSPLSGDSDYCCCVKKKR